MVATITCALSLAAMAETTVGYEDVGDTAGERIIGKLAALGLASSCGGANAPPHEF